ncbi:hypothetical protein ASE94_19270 [Devosia sp. Leaf64]|nr:hypothetical protein ASE94_19270 [Devosia sp. Leaf64]
MSQSGALCFSRLWLLNIWTTPGTNRVRITIEVEIPGLFYAMAGRPMGKALPLDLLEAANRFLGLHVHDQTPNFKV